MISCMEIEIVMETWCVVMMIDIDDLKVLKNGDKIPAVGLGTWRIGGSFVVDHSKDYHWVRVLKYGISVSLGIVGMCLIDTAEMYGAGHSEEIVGSAISGFDREDIFIVTKVKGENLAYKRLIRAANRSLDRLNVEYIDLYLIHWPNFSVPLSETMKAMEYLYNEGKIRYIGVSNFDVSLLESARECLSYTDIVVNQVKYNVMDRGVEKDMLPYCQREGIILMAYTPLEHGRLAKNEILKYMGEKYGKTAAQVALNWLVSKKNVVAIPKSERKLRIKENLGAMGWRLKPEDIMFIDKRFPV